MGNEETRETDHFLKSHPEIKALSRPSAERLCRISDPALRRKSIREVAKRLARARDLSYPGSSICHCDISEMKVAKIILEEKKRGHPFTSAFSRIRVLNCTCGSRLETSASVRSRVITVRFTSEDDDALLYVSRQLGVSKSLLVHTLLKASLKFPSLPQEISP